PCTKPRDRASLRAAPSWRSGRWPPDSPLEPGFRARLEQARQHSDEPRSEPKFAGIVFCPELRRDRLVPIGSKRSGLDAALEDNCDVLRFVAIRVGHYEIRSAVHGVQPCRPNEQSCLFPHLAYDGVGRCLARVDGAAGRAPDLVISLLHEQNAAASIANDAGDGWKQKTRVADGGSEIAYVR